MTDYLSVEQARSQTGMRLVLVQGVPGPWGEAIKAIYDLKGIDYQAVAQLAGQENQELLEWTGQTSAPVAAYNDERIRISWENMVWQAEQLAPEPRLIPEDARERVAMFGLLREFAGECGFAWDRRLQVLHLAGGPDANPLVRTLCSKYGYSETEVENSWQRLGQLLTLCSDILEDQAAKGSPFYIGNALTAVDIYAAVMASIMIKPLDHEQIPMPEGMRMGYAMPHPSIDQARDAFWTHREFIAENYLKLPLAF